MLGERRLIHVSTTVSESSCREDRENISQYTSHPFGNSIPSNDASTPMAMSTTATTSYNIAPLVFFVVVPSYVVRHDDVFARTIFRRTRPNALSQSLSSVRQQHVLVAVDVFEIEEVDVRRDRIFFASRSIELRHVGHSHGSTT